MARRAIALRSRSFQLPVSSLEDRRYASVEPVNRRDVTDGAVQEDCVIVIDELGDNPFGVSSESGVFSRMHSFFSVRW